MAESNYERQQRLAAQRMLRSAMPNINKMMQDILRSQVNVPDIGKLYSDHYRDMISSLSKNAALLAATPTIDVIKLMPEIPALKLDYSSLFPDFTAVHRNMWESLRPSIDAIQTLQRSQFADIIKNAQALARASLPPNWRDPAITIPADLEAMLLDEGLALAWVPPTAVVAKLFKASSAQERRRILGARWVLVANSCIAELRTIQEPELAEHVEFALDAATTLLAGKPRPAQALSANLLDTILRKNFDANTFKTVTGQKIRMNMDEYPLRVAVVLGGIWGSFGEFWTTNGDKVPRKFTRHGSAHAVSRRQYSRINSLLALMHVVSLLKLLDSDLAQLGK